MPLVACSGAASSGNGGEPGDGVGVDGGHGVTNHDAGSGGSSGGDGATHPQPGTDAGSTTAPDGGGSGSHDGGDAGGGSPDGGGAGAPSSEFAPYFPTWVWGASGYAYTSLVDLQKKAHVNDVTIAFVLSNGGCDTTQDIEQNAADVKAFVAAGGHVKASFGGADGTYVEAKCANASALAAAIGNFVDATGITDLDFDIEQDPVLTDTVNAMRGQALASVQASKGIQVAFTLAANPHTSGSPGGLTSQGLSVVTHAVSAGVHVAHVNLMTMDYGDSYAGQALAPVAIGSLTDANAQLVKAVAGLDAPHAWQMLGVIPMIGKNDDSEVFSIADAKSLESFAVQNRLGLVSFWSIDRDQVCPSGADYNTCSTVDTTNFEFA
ncbi:MAG TPA: glycosyl hydrolase family 18 protein, partial [Polyangiaceae bacterium]